MVIDRGVAVGPATLTALVGALETVVEGEFYYVNLSVGLTCAGNWSWFLNSQSSSILRCSKRSSLLLECKFNIYHIGLFSSMLPGTLSWFDGLLS